MLARLCLIAIAVPLAISPSTVSCFRGGGGQSSTLSDSEFSRMTNEISEEGGYFWSNNYISNETSYLHVMDQLEALADHEGVYVGVGPNQNFTYIAAVRPELAFIVDIRRQNLLEHLIFKTFIEKAETRGEYLSALIARPLAGPDFGPDASLGKIVARLERTAPDENFFAQQLDELKSSLRAFAGLDLSDTDYRDVEFIYREFFKQGLNIKYDSWRSFFFPSLKEFLLETDLEGRHRNWLASAETYRYIRDMHRSNRIIPIVGDFAGDDAFRRLGRLLEARGATVKSFYLSNVEFYLFRQRRWNAFVENVRQLPTDENSVFIRAYANLHRPHPNMVDDHITITLVQNIERFLDNAGAGRYRNLWDVVTTAEY